MMKTNFLIIVSFIILIASIEGYISKIIKNPNLGYNKVSTSKLGIYGRAAVSTDANQCASVGRNILELNGNAIDAAIAMIVCTGVVLPHSSGLGGGFYLNFYNRTARKAYTIDARETAPNNSDEFMFRGNNLLSEEGGLAIAVPGEVAGLEEAHRRFGSLPWKVLFEGAIKLARNGFVVSHPLSNALQNNQTLESIRRFPDLREYLTNRETGDIYKKGDVMRRPEYAETLQTIANKGSKEFYSGELTKTLVNDIRRNGGIIRLDDFGKYRAIIRKPIYLSLRNGDTLLSAPPPASGGLLAFILNIMDGYRSVNPEDLAISLNNTATYYHRYVEALKFSFAKRTLMGDPDYDNVTDFMRDVISKDYANYIRSRIIDNKTFNDPKYYGAHEVAKSDHGTVHTTVVDQYGNAVSIGSTINLYFGSKVMSPKTGVIFNNQMAEFSSPEITTLYSMPPSKANRIVPGKRPVSSKSSAIVIDKSGDVKLAIGGTGGTHMISGVAATIMRTLWLQDSIKDAIDAPRIHHQLFPNVILHERTFPQEILRKLRSFGHRTIKLEGIDRRDFDPKESITLDPRLTGSITLGIIRGYDGLLYANSDYRKGGTVDGF